MFDTAVNSLSLISRLGSVRRARGHRLYRSDGRRFVDLWQVGGRAVLGHNPPGVLLGLKNTADHGLLAPFSNPAHERLSKAIARLPGLEGRTVRLYADPSSAARALKAVRVTFRDLADPALSGPPPVDGSMAALWRPFLGDAGASSGLPAILVPVLPLPLANGPVAVAFQGPAELPPDDILSPVIAHAALRAVEILLRIWSERSAAPAFAVIEKGLSRTDSPWSRRGIYLSLKSPIADEAWEELFGFFLDGGFLLPPGQGLPVILPAELSDGEEKQLAELLEVARNWL